MFTPTILYAKSIVSMGTISVQSPKVSATASDIKALGHHIDSRTRIYPQVAGTTITLISDAVADTFGDWTEIVPIDTIDFAYKVVGVNIYGVDAASDYFIQLGHSLADLTEPTDADIMGEREMRITDVPIAQATALIDFHCSGCPANAKLWGRLKTDGGATDEVYITVTVVRHIELRGAFDILATWPWST